MLHLHILCDLSKSSNISSCIFFEKQFHRTIFGKIYLRTFLHLDKFYLIFHSYKWQKKLRTWCLHWSSIFHKYAYQKGKNALMEQHMNIFVNNKNCNISIENDEFGRRPLLAWRFGFIFIFQKLLSENIFLKYPKKGEFRKRITYATLPSKILGEKSFSLYIYLL